MFFELNCACGASLSLDLPEDMNTLALMWADQFVKGHVKCGYMVTALPTADNEEWFTTELDQEN